MTSEARETTAVRSQGSFATPFQIAYAVALVGAGLLAAVVLLYGITHSHSPGGPLWVAVGAVSYLAAWGWGIRLAMSD